LRSFSRSAFIFLSPAQPAPASPLLGTAFFSVGRRIRAPAQARASPAHPHPQQDSPSCGAFARPYSRRPDDPEAQPTHISQEQPRGVQAKRIFTEAATPSPSPVPPVAPARARSPTPDSPDSDSPRPLTYPSKVRSRRGDQRMRCTCAPEHFASGRAQRTWRFACGAGCEYAGVCSASTALSQVEIGVWKRTEAAQREGIPSRAEDRRLRAHFGHSGRRKRRGISRHPSSIGQHRTCAEAA
jgi:hypothetical protein